MTLHPAEVAIPEAEVRTALLSAAVPGWTGSVRITFRVQPEAAQAIVLQVDRSQKEPVGQTTERVHLNIPLRERTQRVDDKLRELKPRLTLRPRVIAIVGHYVDGQLRNCDIEDIP